MWFPAKVVIPIERQFSSIFDFPMTRYRWLSISIFVAALALYAFTAAPSIVELFDDSLEFQLVGPTLGIAHPTGYPLYTLLGALWSRVLFPFGNWAWRMNMLSALFGALTVWLLYRLGRILAPHADGTPNELTGLAAAITFALGTVWWSQATVAEVYTLHAFLVAAILNVAIGMNRTLDEASPTPNTQAFRRRMTLLMLLIGLGLAHHRTTVLLLPGLAIYLLWSIPGVWRPQRVWLLWLAALLAPLLLYGLLPLRASLGVSDLNRAYVNTWNGFLDHVLARRYGAFFVDNVLTVQHSLRDWLDIFVAQVGWIGLILGVLGLAWLVDRQRRPVKAWVFVLIVLLTNLLFAINYQVGDVEVFLLPVFLCLALFIGAGVGLVGRLLALRSEPSALVGQGALIMLLALGVGGRGPMVNRSDDWAAHDYAVSMAKVNYPPDSRVLGLEGEMTALRYMQQAEGLGLNATPVVADDPALRSQMVTEFVAAGYPLFLTRELDGIAARYSFSGAGPLVRVWPRGEAQAGQAQHALDASMADGALGLTGYDLEILERAGGPALGLTLYWRPERELVRDFKVSLRMLDSDGTPIAGADGAPVVTDRFPLHQVAPTSTWVTGETIRDVHILDLPDDWREEASALQIILYNAETVDEAGRWTFDLTP